MRRLVQLLLMAGIFLVFNSHSGIAQKDEASQMEQIKKQMDPADQKSITAAENALLQAKKLADDGESGLQKAEAKRNSAENASKKDKKKLTKEAEKLESDAYDKKIKASAKFDEANKIFYATYKKNLTKLGQKADDTRRKQVSDLEKKADIYYKQSAPKRKKATSIKDKKIQTKTLAEAEDLESSAISSQLKAYNIFLGSDAQEDKTKEEVKTVIVPEVKKDTIKTAPVNTQENNTENTNQTGVIFKVQIAASKVPLSVEKLRQIYPSDEIINNEKEGDWYKYSVGYFSSYDKAYAFKQKIAVNGAFIIAYKNNVKVKNITEVAKAIDNKSNVITGNTEFRIQVGMTKFPASEKEIKQMNPTSLPVKTYQTGGWNKYTVGSFKTNEEAKRFQSDNKLSTATTIIVKYKDNAEIK